MPAPTRLWTPGLLSRRAVFAAVAAACCVPAASAQTAPSPRTEAVQTIDGWALPVTYYEAAGANENTPVVVLLHGAQESRKNWESLAEYLQKTGGFSVLAPDFRKNGEATLNGQAISGDTLTPNDYQAMVAADFEAVKALAVALHEQKKLNVRKLGLVAADEAAPIALLATYADWRKLPLRDAPDPMFRTPTGQDVRAVVLFSPAKRVPGLNESRVLRDLKSDAADIAFLILVGERDDQDDGAAAALADRLGGRPDRRTNKRPSDRVTLVPVPGVPLRGTTLLRPPVGDEVKRGVTKFLTQYVKDRPDPWKSRQGAL